MALASLFGGLALANARLGAVHGFAGVFGGMFDSPHGAVCAALLPHCMAINIKALQQRQPDGEALHRYEEAAQVLTGDPEATAVDGVAWMEVLCEELLIPGLGAYGLQERDFPELIEKSSKASSMQGNPIKLTVEEMEEVLKRAI
jgi:alcohol dehydrogenase class IV